MYVVYDRDARTCTATDLPLPTASHQSVPVRVCRTPAADLVGHPDAVLGPLNADYACAAPPPAPNDLRIVSNSHRVVELAWTPPAGRRALAVVEAGSAPDKADILVKDVGWATTFTTPASPGTYHARVRARNMCGTGAASNELVVVVE